MEPSTVLFLAANPVRLQALELGEECRAIENKIRQSKFRDQIRFRPRWAARPDDLIQALNEDTPSVLHFSGHGTGDQGLCFQSEDGSALHVSTDSLVHVMRAAGASVAVVVLNACFSEAQAQALAGHVPCVVGMSGAIGDRSAMVYAGTFYRALASGRSVANAHDQGIAALGLPCVDGQQRDVDRTARAPQQASPRLLTRADTDADALYLAGAPTAKRRCVLVIKATLRDFDSEVLARVTDELRRLTGDLSVQITDVEEGSVRLTISLSPAAAKILVKLKATGQLTKLGGFEVSDVVELATATATAQRAAFVEVAAAATAQQIVRRERTTQRPAHGASHSVQTGRESVERQPLPPDTDILDLVATVDIDRALRFLIQCYGTSVYRFCRAELLDAALAYDIQELLDAALASDVHESVFIELFRELPVGPDLPRFLHNDVRSWLFATARYRVLDAVNAIRRRIHAEDDAESWLAERTGDDNFQELLVEGTRSLDPKVRSALLLRYQQGFTFDEMATICGEQAETLRARVARALPRLRAYIEGRIGRIP